MILFSLRHTNPKTAAQINGHATVPIGAQATIQAAVPAKVHPKPWIVSQTVVQIVQFDHIRLSSLFCVEERNSLTSYNGFVCHS